MQAEKIMSLEQANKYIVLFFTHSGAVKYRRFLNKNNIDNEMMPVPRRLSSSCGVCISFCYDDISSIITTDIEKIFKEIDGSKFEEIYTTN